MAVDALCKQCHQPFRWTCGSPMVCSHECRLLAEERAHLEEGKSREITVGGYKMRGAPIDNKD
jgi:hypothetical protein